MGLEQWKNAVDQGPKKNENNLSTKGIDSPKTEQEIEAAKKEVEKQIASLLGYIKTVSSESSGQEQAVDSRGGLEKIGTELKEILEAVHSLPNQKEMISSLVEELGSGEIDPAVKVQILAILRRYYNQN